MFNNSWKILFMMMMILGSMITMSANSWLSAWMGLEINLLSFIPLMSGKTLNSSESSMKYFLIQALASAILLLASIMLFMENYNILFMSSFYSTLIIISSLLMKLGAAPFHFWFPNVMETLNWINSLILMTWQKLAPFILLSYLTPSNLIFISMLFSVLIGSIMGLNQTSIRKLMAFSSINHLGWMMGLLIFNKTMWLSYFLIYSFLSMNLIFLFQYFNINHISQLKTLNFNSKMIKFMLMISLLSLGGLPPFLGFLPKWTLIQWLIMENQFFLTMILIMTTLITLFFYLRLSYLSFMMGHLENNWNMKLWINNSFYTLFLIYSFLSIIGLPVIYYMYMLF